MSAIVDGVVADDSVDEGFVIEDLAKLPVAANVVKRAESSSQ